MSNGADKYTIPGEYSFDGFVMGDQIADRKTLEALKEGRGPSYTTLVASYPRTGTARILEVCWLLMNNCDVMKAKEQPQNFRHLFLDLCDPAFKTCYNGKPLPQENFPLVKSHFPFPLMEEHSRRDTRIVVGLRNPKDNLVSLYHFYRMNATLGKFTGSFHDFFRLYKSKHLMYGDMFDYYVGWWGAKDRKNIMYVFFEDMTEDPVREVKRIAEFFGKEYSDEDIIKIVEWTTFGNMKEEKSTNYDGVQILDTKISPYMRKGQVGDWKNYFNEEQSSYIDKQCEQRCTPIGLEFRFEL